MLYELGTVTMLPRHSGEHAWSGNLVERSEYVTHAAHESAILFGSHKALFKVVSPQHKAAGT
eukprot:scaffold28080_cov18-Tisochrysis_lutea.AAC.1